jgi:hypothetical protein
MPRPDVFSERKSSSMMTMGKRNFMHVSKKASRPWQICRGGQGATGSVAKNKNGILAEIGRLREKKLS